MTLAGSICLVFMCLATTILGQWKGTRMYYSSGEEAAKAFLHINTDTGMVHNFGTAGKKIIHRRYRASFGSINTISSTQSAHFLDVIHTKHTAANLRASDDQIIVLTYASSRSGEPIKDCTKSNTKGCSEIYIAESYDDGATWKKPITIERANAQDVVHRSKATLGYDREQNVIYIVYTYQNLETGESSLGLARKYVVEGKYRKEEHLKVPGNFKKLMNPKITVTNPQKHKGDLHLVFIGELEGGNQTICYTKSVDNAATWKAPLLLKPAEAVGVQHASINAIGIAGLEDVFLAYSRGPAGLLMFIYSKDGGNTWSEPRQMTTKPGLVPYTRACGQTRTLGVLLSMFPEDTNDAYELVYYNVTSGTYSDFVKPFRDLPELPRFPFADCTGLTDNDIKIVAAAAYRTSHAFDDYHYDYPAIYAH